MAVTNTFDVAPAVPAPLTTTVSTDAPTITSDKVGALGWAPETSFDDALDETVRFYADRRDWWEPLTARVKNR